MSQLIQLGEHTYYIPAATNAGVYVQDDCAYLIDSGLNDKQAAEYLALIQARGCRLTAVFNTHYHADHVGGNRYLQEQTGCACYCPLSQFVCRPLLNSSMIYGACTPEALQTEVFFAPMSQTDELTADVLPEGLTLFPLPGHCAVQMGIETADGVLFCADALMGKEEMLRYGFSHLYNLSDYLASLDALAQHSARVFVPSHSAPMEQIFILAEQNRHSCEGLMNQILQFCQGDGLNSDELLRQIFNAMGKHLHYAQYVLSGSTLRAYLSHLMNIGALTVCQEDNLLRFRTK